jgi:hypothetical protein
MAGLIGQIILAILAAVGILLFAVFLFLRVADKLLRVFNKKP